MTGRGDPRKILTWIGFAAIGAAGGLLLGHFVLGEEGARSGGLASYAELTGNPHAPGPPPAPVDPCYDCVDGYGRGIRHAPDREARMDDAFRELGAVEIDYGSEPAEDYSYGGRFDEPAAAPIIVMQSPVPEATPAAAPIIAVPAVEPPPANETAAAPPP